MTGSDPVKANSTYVQEKQTVSRALWMGFTENNGLHHRKKNGEKQIQKIKNR